jgi:hypothetical protein
MRCFGELADVINFHTWPRMSQPCQAAFDLNDNRSTLAQMAESYGQQLMWKPAECISGRRVFGVQHYRRPRAACALRQVTMNSETITNLTLRQAGGSGCCLDS